MRGVPVSELQNVKDVDSAAIQNTEVRAEDLVGLISESRRKLF